MHLKKKVDANHATVVDALRSHDNVSVFSTASIGKGIPDLVVGMDGWTVLVEVKVGRKKLNTFQRAWHKGWHGTPVVVLRSVDEAHTLVKNIRMARRIFGDHTPRAEDVSV